MRRLFSFAARALFIGNLALGTVAFLLFLNWYDTGEASGDGWYIAAIGGTLWGGLALMVEVWLYDRYKFWPDNRFAFFLRMIILSVLCIDLGFSTSSGAYLAVSQAINGDGLPASLSALAITPILTLIFLPMIVPFGLFAGLANGLLLHFSHSYDRK
jgi:hypothetical protein